MVEGTLAVQWSPNIVWAITAILLIDTRVSNKSIGKKDEQSKPKQASCFSALLQWPGLELKVLVIEESLW